MADNEADCLHQKYVTELFFRKKHIAIDFILEILFVFVFYSFWLSIDTKKILARVLALLI